MLTLEVTLLRPAIHERLSGEWGMPFWEVMKILDKKAVLAKNDTARERIRAQINAFLEYEARQMSRYT